MKKQKENSLENITWSEMGKQNVQAKEVYCCSQMLIALMIGQCAAQSHKSGAQVPF